MNWNWRTVPVQHGKCVFTSGKIWPTVWLWTEKLHPTIRVRSYWNLRVKKNPTRYHVTCSNFCKITWPLRFSSFVTTCLAVLAFYPNSGNGRTRRPDITILHLRIHIVLLWLKTSTASFFFLIKTVSTTHPPLFHYPLFLCDSFKIFYICTFKFPPFVFFLFLTNLIYLITGNKKRKKYVVSLLHCGGVRYRVMIRRSSASPYV